MSRFLQQRLMMRTVLMVLMVLLQAERAFSVCGTIEYMAPEIVEGGQSGHDKVRRRFLFLKRRSLSSR